MHASVLLVPCPVLLPENAQIMQRTRLTAHETACFPMHPFLVTTLVTLSNVLAVKSAMATATKASNLQ